MKDKVDMQKGFIKKIENQAKSDIDKKKDLIQSYEDNIKEKYQMDLS